MIGTRPLDMRIEPVVYGPLAAKQYTLFRDLASLRRRALHVAVEDAPWRCSSWSRSAATGEVLLGCPMDYPAELDDAPTLAGLLATARAIAEDFPGLRDAPIDRVWAGCCRTRPTRCRSSTSPSRACSSPPGTSSATPPGR